MPFDRDRMGFPAGFEFCFSRQNAVFHRADVQAEMATDAAVVDRRGARVFVPVDGLMPAVEARDNTAAAPDAFRLVDAGNDHEVAVEVIRSNDVRQGFPDKVGEFFNAFFFHEV